MLKFMYGDKTLAYMPRVGATIDQVRACRERVADINGVKYTSIIIKCGGV